MSSSPDCRNAAPAPPFRISILLSGKHGRGSNLAMIQAACESGQIPNSKVVRVIGTSSESPALDRARGLGIATTCISPRKPDFDQLLLAALEEDRPDAIVLAGYMRKIPSAVLAAFPSRIVNIHPGLLPAFGGQGMYGARVHEAVIEYGAKVTGCTVHLIDEEYDTGPIILQRAIDVLETDNAHSLAERVLHLEHQAYPEAVALMAERRLEIVGRRVHIRPAGTELET